MACENIVGVKNIAFTFFDCETNQSIGPIVHKLAGDDLPTVRACTWKSERLANGFVKRQASEASIEMKVIRDLRVPLSWYQGCVAINAQVEYVNGLVYTGRGGGVTGDDKSDTHEVNLNIVFRTLDELLPSGALAA